jgi:hypothetical protein
MEKLFQYELNYYTMTEEKNERPGKKVRFHKNGEGITPCMILVALYQSLKLSHG